MAYHVSSATNSHQPQFIKDVPHGMRVEAVRVGLRFILSASGVFLLLEVVPFVGEDFSASHASDRNDHVSAYTLDTLFVYMGIFATNKHRNSSQTMSK